MVKSKLYEQILSSANLLLAWRKVLANRGGPGGDRQTLDDFAADLEANLKQLHEALWKGTYRPGPFRNLGIPKRDGSSRLLSIPSVVDRVAQTAVAQGLSPILEPRMEDSSFAYRPGRSVGMAVERIQRHFRQGYHWVVDGDIDDYFDSIPHSRLMEILGRYIDDARVLGLIALWLRHGSADGVGLAQGSPLSPLLANIYLDDIDERICQKGVRLVRFADDFVLLCNQLHQAEAALKKMIDLLAEYGLRLNPDKTRIVSFDQGFQFLGHLFVRSVVLEHQDSCDPPPDADPPAESPALPSPALPEEADPPPVEPLHQAAERDDSWRLSPRLRVMYLTGEGRYLDVRNRAFVVRAAADKSASELVAVLPRRLDRVELWPGADISAKAQRYALDSGVQVAYVDGWGHTLGTLEPTPSAKAGLHLAQAGVALDGPKRLDLARRICTGKVRNQRALLNRLNRKRKDRRIQKRLSELNAILKKIKSAGSVAQLLGLEGEAAKGYWAALALVVAPEWGFTRRIRRPPGDPVNLVISLAASLIYRDLHCLAARHGLHPGFGALHGSLDDKPGCVSDLVEEFRAALSEGLAAYLANNQIIKHEMFFQATDRPCQVTPEGRDVIIRSFEAWLDRPVKSPRSGEAIKWRGLMEEQVLAYRAHVLDERPYQPYDMKY